VPKLIPHQNLVGILKGPAVILEDLSGKETGGCPSPDPRARNISDSLKVLLSLNTTRISRAPLETILNNFQSGTADFISFLELPQIDL